MMLIVQSICLIIGLVTKIEAFYGFALGIGLYYSVKEVMK